MAEELVWNVGTWNGYVWGPYNLQTSTPIVTQECVAYTPTYPNVPLPPTSPYFPKIEATAVLYFKPGIYWERCLQEYIGPNGQIITPTLYWGIGDWDEDVWG